jgi:hypothetical protein
MIVDASAGTACPGRIQVQVGDEKISCSRNLRNGRKSMEFQATLGGTKEIEKLQ